MEDQEFLLYLRMMPALTFLPRQHLIGALERLPFQIQEP